MGSYSVPGPLLGARDARKKKKVLVPTLMELIIVAWTGSMTMVMVNSLTLTKCENQLS